MNYTDVFSLHVISPEIQFTEFSLIDLCHFIKETSLFLSHIVTSFLLLVLFPFYYFQQKWVLSTLSYILDVQKLLILFCKSLITYRDLYLYFKFLVEEKTVRFLLFCKYSILEPSHIYHFFILNGWCL